MQSLLYTALDESRKGFRHVLIFESTPALFMQRLQCNILNKYVFLRGVCATMSSSKRALGDGHAVEQETAQRSSGMRAEGTSSFLTYKHI